MPGDGDRLEELFAEALDIRPERRMSYLEAVVPDPDLRAAVLTLLESHATDGALDRVTAWLRADLPASEGLPPGHRIGSYEIVRPLSRGGMGAVYLAHRADGQLEYDVALKILRWDLQTEELKRRFLVERQILARINHPHIARLLDGGVTGDGRPWFAMELVDGLPIDEYCDRNRLGLRQRLALFETVCEATQHAHRSLVVHRDIKPSNILVTTSGAVKLLDFGVAKALDPETSRGLEARTRTGVRLLTPEYASPEQIRGDPVTTASDVYQLGILLHLLLTGSVPRLSDGARTSASVTRVVTKPSAVVGRAGGCEGDGADSDPPTPREIADARGTTPERLRRRLRGDLDNIVLLSLREEPERRYESVAQLAEDVRRHLDGHPVRARPERPAYVAAKFVRRHRAGVAASVAALVLIVAFAVAMAVQVRRVADERDRTEQVSALLMGMFEAASPSVARGDTLDVFELLDRGVDEVRRSSDARADLRGTLFGVLADVYEDLAEYPTAVALAWAAADAWETFAGPEDPRAVGSLTRVAAVLGAAGQADSAEAVAARALARAPWRRGSNGLVRARATQALAYALQLKGESARAESLVTDAVGLYRHLPGDSARLGLASALVNLGWLHENAGRHDAALSSLRESVAIRRELLDPEHPRLLNSLGGLGTMLLRRQRLAEAEPLLAEALELNRRFYGPDHPAVAAALQPYARLLAEKGALDRAERYYLEALDLTRAEGSSLALGQILNDLGLFLQWRRGGFAEAERRFREASPVFAELRGPTDVWTLTIRANLATAIAFQNRYEEADEIFQKVIPGIEAASSSTAPVLGPPLVSHGLVLSRLGRPGDAEEALRRGLEIERATGDARRTARAEAALGIHLRRHGDPGEAAGLLRRAWPVVETGPPFDPLRGWTAEAVASLDPPAPGG